MEKRILVIDDEPDIVELLADELRFEGFSARECYSGNSAIEILSSNERFDIAISDYKMPNGNGRVVLDYIKSMDKMIRPIFYFVSGQADISHEEALKEGVKRFFYKPFDIDDLIRTLKRDLDIK